MGEKNNGGNHRKKRKSRNSRARPERIPLTDEIVAQIEAEIERTGVKPTRYFAQHGHDGPLYDVRIHKWRNKQVKSALKTDLDVFFELWSALPDTSQIVITPELRAEMRDHRNRTGAGPNALMRGLRPGASGRVEPTTIRAWMSGPTKTAEREHVELVLKRWQKLPDKSEVMISVSDQHIAHVRAELARTGVSQSQLFQDRKDIPKGLTHPIFLHFLNGRTQEFPKDCYEYIVVFLRELPTDAGADKGPRQRGLRKGRVHLTEDMRNALLSERQRTGIGETALVRIMASDGKVPPPSRRIHEWISGYVKSVPREQYDMVLSAWRELPDASTTAS